MDAPALEVSSTEIRQAVAAGRSIDDMVPPAVAAYIREKNLYREGDGTHGNDGENDRQSRVSGGIDRAMLDGLAAEVAASGLSPKRLRHVLAVRDMAARLAELYCPEDTEILQAAALLHDMTKELSPAGADRAVRPLRNPRTRGDVLAPKCFHAMTAAAPIPVMYPAFADPRIVSAVRWHTTGRVGMTLDEADLSADYIDESRTFPDCVTLRNLFWDAHRSRWRCLHGLRISAPC